MGYKWIRIWNTLAGYGYDTEVQLHALLLDYAVFECDGTVIACYVGGAS